MSFDINAIRTDPKKDVEGVWREPRPGLRLLIARMGNPRYMQELRRLTKPYRKRSLTDEEDAQVLFDCTTRAMAKCILLGWEGLCDRGEPVTYSQDLAYEYMSKVDEFRTMVMDEAAILDSFRAEDAEDSSKNSLTLSGGKPAGGVNLKKRSGEPAADSGS